MDKILESLNGYKTYGAALGLAGLAMYQFSQGQYELAFQSLMAALAAVGVKHAIERQGGEVAEMKAKLSRKE